METVGVIFKNEGYAQAYGEIKNFNVGYADIAKSSKASASGVNDFGAAIKRSLIETGSFKSASVSIDAAGQATAKLSYQSNAAAESAQAMKAAQLANAQATTQAKQQAIDEATALAPLKAKKLEVSAAAQDLKNQLLQQKLAQSQATEEAVKGPSVYDRLTSAVKNVSSAAGEAGGKLVSFAGDAVGNMVSGLEKVGSTAISAGVSVVKFGVQVAEAGAQHVIAFGKSAVKVTQDFNAKMSEVQAVSGATAEQLQRMNDKALELGAKFPVSASDAAEAMGELSKAGFNAEQSIQASTGVVELASATHYSMANSATYLANAINQFGLSAADAGHVTDLFAQSANASAVDVSDLAKTFEYVGPVARAAGFSMEDTAKAASVLGNAGIKGSSAGTGLKTVLSQLAAPGDKAAAAFQKLGYSVTDSNGKIKPLQQQLIELRGKFKDLDSAQQIDMAQKIVGKDHFSKLLALMDATDDSFNQVSVAIDGADGAGKRMSDTMNDNLAGAVQNISGSFETLQIKVGQMFEPMLKGAVNFGAGLINRVIPFVDAFGVKMSAAMTHGKAAWQEFQASFSGKPLKLGGTEVAQTSFTRLGDSVRLLMKTFGELGKALSGKNPFSDMGKAASDAHPLIDGLATGITKFSGFIESNIGNIAKFADTVGMVAGKIIQFDEAVSPLKIVFDMVTGFFQGGVNGALDAFGQHVTEAGKVFGVDLTAQVKTGIGIVTGVIQTLSGVVNTIFTGISAFVQQHGAEIMSIVAGTWNTVTGIIQGALSIIVGVVQPILGSIGDFINQHSAEIKQALSDAWGFISGAVQLAVQGIQNYVIPALNAVGAFLQQHSAEIQATLTNAWNLIYGAISTAINLIKGVIDTVSGAIKQIWSEHGEQIKKIATDAWNAISSAISTVVNAIKPIIDTALSAIKQFWTDHGEQIKTIVSTAFEAIKKTVQTIIDIVSSIIKTALDGIQAFWNTFGGTITKLWQTTWDTISGAVKGIIATVTGTIGGFIDLITGKWSSLGDDLKKTWQGMWDTIGSIVTGAVTNITTIGGGIIKFFTDLPGNIIKALGDFGATLLSPFKGAWDGVIDFFKNIHIPLPHFNVTVGNFDVGPISIPVPNVTIDWYAKGGLAKGGPSIVGEAGAELLQFPSGQIMLAAKQTMLNLPKNTMVYNAAQTSQMLGGASRYSAPASAGQIINNMNTTSSYAPVANDNRTYNMPLNVASSMPVSSANSGYAVRQAMLPR